MTEKELTKSKAELMEEIETVRSLANQKGGINMRAKEDIFRLLGKAIKCIEDSDTEYSRNEAASNISLARQRITQAEGKQKRWLAFLLGIWLIFFLVGGAWAIYQGEFWPKAVETEGQEILFGAVLWGVVGAAIDGLYELHKRLARQEFDSNRVAWYIFHPLIGAGLGGILFLLVSAGLVVTQQDAGEFNPSLPLILAALAGFEQQHIVYFLQETFRKMLNIEEKTPNEGG